MPDPRSPGRASWHLADNTLSSIQDTLRALLHDRANTGDTFACDILHDRIARLDDARAILSGEDDDLRAILPLTS